ncbi:uncharacterized protein SPPG_01557 [Spizellomyces punctatus DAOM BR117]|uniref:GOLD domain-containing protein n=1 Tax=Spizellomyces punctatus (strain DAOM BR117) TaxID=645134 RepID=A0A0L0HSN8_SPIPD|nr:uncharacterized protein SPPG_01557 [Spizellomyces punctatus DAOM BR117]KND04118.1 hypothetical protein SPPG_01557 [Spizellomyces punctatus DAOM BR117]|eukprot:XP_016612157.1 hypothetical protein SPPG_01557 [Spizellomyces punctatus DAOM BR117]
MKAILVSLFLLGAIVAPIAALNTFTLYVPARTELCFNEYLQHKDRLDLSFEVEEGGNLDIDFVIYTPSSKPLYSLNGESSSHFGFNAEAEGKYVYCFGNKMSSMVEKRLSFSVHGPDERWKIEELEMKQSIDDPTETLQSEIRVLDAGIRAIQDEHAFLMQRERRHRQTADSTRSRVLYWTLLQTAVLLGVCYFQVTYLKKFFEMRGGRIV